jgi:hypothetical protein
MFELESSQTYRKQIHTVTGMKLVILVYPHYSIYAIFDFEQRAKEHREFLHARNTFSTMTYIYNFAGRKNNLLTGISTPADFAILTTSPIMNSTSIGRPL